MSILFLMNFMMKWKAVIKIGNQCIGCGSGTVAIQVIDRGDGNSNYEPIYAAGESKLIFDNSHEIKDLTDAELF